MYFVFVRHFGARKELKEAQLQRCGNSQIASPFKGGHKILEMGDRVLVRNCRFVEGIAYIIAILGSLLTLSVLFICYTTLTGL